MKDASARAEEHLQVIRSLMERATIYRAISAPTALCGGLLALLASVLLYNGNAREAVSFFKLSFPGAARHFILIWLVVLAATLLANTFFIARKARREGSAFLTSGLRLAIAAATPALLVAATLTLIFWRNDETTEALPILAATWITGYGLALLSTASFAPASLRLLGWAFLVAGLAALLLTGPLFSADPARHTALAMGITFGLFHLIYGVATWPRPRTTA